MTSLARPGAHHPGDPRVGGRLAASQCTDGPRAPVKRSYALITLPVGPAFQVSGRQAGVAGPSQRCFDQSLVELPVQGEFRFAASFEVLENHACAAHRCLAGSWGAGGTVSAVGRIPTVRADPKR